jgi:hypothetical protein
MSSDRIELWAGWSLALPSPCQTRRKRDGSWSACVVTLLTETELVEPNSPELLKPWPIPELVRSVHPQPWASAPGARDHPRAAVRIAVQPFAEVGPSTGQTLLHGITMVQSVITRKLT